MRIEDDILELEFQIQVAKMADVFRDRLMAGKRLYMDGTNWRWDQGENFKPTPVDRTAAIEVYAGNHLGFVWRPDTSVSLDPDVSPVWVLRKRIHRELPDTEV